MGTKTGFTGFRSLIRIQCGLTCASNGMQTMLIALLDWISHTLPDYCHAQHSVQLGYGSKPYGDKMVFGSVSLICIRSGSEVLCEEPY